MKWTKEKLIEIIKEEINLSSSQTEAILDEAESTALKSVKGGIRRATNPTLPPDVLAKNIEAMMKQLDDDMSINHKSFNTLSADEKNEAMIYAYGRMKYAVEAAKKIEAGKKAEVEAEEQEDPTPEATTDTIEGTTSLTTTDLGTGTAGEDIDITVVKEKYGPQLAKLELENIENVSMLKFIQFMLNKKIISENLLKGLRHFEFDEATKNAMLRIMTPQEKKGLNTGFKKIYQDEDKLNIFLGMFDDTPEASEETPESEEDQPQTEVLPSGEKAIVAALPELQNAFQIFSDDDKGFMEVTYLKDQDKMIGALRSALRKFIGLEGFEGALIREQEEQDPQSPPPEDKTKGARQKLVKDVGRYRRDLNDTGNILGEYLKAAKGGLFKAQPILNKLKIELQKVQDNNSIIVRDLKSVAGIKENLLTEEETREEKIVKVEAAYNAIVDLLRPTLQIRTPEPTETTSTASTEETEETSDSIEEVILEDIYLEQTGPTEEELQSLVDAVKQSLEQIDNIKQYFRVIGTFNKPLGELQTDFLEYVGGYKKTMSDLVVDLRQGVPSPENATQYAIGFARLAAKIQEDFGISPREPIKVAGAPTVQPAGEDDTTVPAINDSPEAERQVSDADTEVENGPEEEKTPEEIQKDVNDFVKKSKKFLTNIITPFTRALLDNDKAKISKIQQKLGRLMRRNLLEDQQQNEELSNLVYQVKSAKDLIVDTILGSSPDQILTLKDDLNTTIKIYLRMHARLLQVYNKPLGTFMNNLKTLDTQIQGDINMLKISFKDLFKKTKDKISPSFLKKIISFFRGKKLPPATEDTLSRERFKIIRNLGNFDTDEDEEINVSPARPPTATLQENLLTRLIKEELKVLNGKKMVCN